jgi:hypothetical protein
MEMQFAKFVLVNQRLESLLEPGRILLDGFKTLEGRQTGLLSRYLLLGLADDLSRPDRPVIAIISLSICHPKLHDSPSLSPATSYSRSIPIN